MKKQGTSGQRGGKPSAVSAAPAHVTAEGRTRHEIARLLLEQGPLSAVAVAEQLGISATAVRRHLDVLVADNEAQTRQAPRKGRRGRGRPAKLFLLTEQGRARFGHAYDDLAVAAIRFLAEHAGEQAVRAFAQRRAATGAQLCQHHCPVAHVAAEFPQLCEAETAAFAELLGTHVQRLATIARGDAACTTHVPADPVGSEGRRRHTLQNVDVDSATSNGGTSA